MSQIENKCFKKKCRQDLLEHGAAEVVANCDGDFTTLHSAARFGQVKVIQILIKKLTAAIEAPGDNFETPSLGSKVRPG